MNENLQRIAIAVTLGIALYAMGHNVDTWEFWAIIALLWTSNFLHYQDGVETGVSTAMEMWVDMTEQQRTDMIDLVTKVRAED
jgi:hypothetical protein